VPLQNSRSTGGVGQLTNAGRISIRMVPSRIANALTPPQAGGGAGEWGQPAPHCAAPDDPGAAAAVPHQGEEFGPGEGEGACDVSSHTLLNPSTSPSSRKAHRGFLPGP
jgi:hypothetical protein